VAATERPQSPRSSALQALNTAALALPGLLLASAQAAEEDVSFQYGHYQESNRELYEVRSRFRPIEVESLQGMARLKFTDRLKFTANYTQDTWSGATPIATAPLSFRGNRDRGIISGATPNLQNGEVYFDKQFRPLRQDAVTGALRRDDRLVHTLSSASPETRKQGDFRLGYEWDEAALTVGGGTSVEHDYESNFGNLGGRFDFNRKLTTLNLNLSYTASSTRALLDHDATPYIQRTTYGNRVEVRSDGSQILRGSRDDWAGTVGLTQVLTKSSLAEVLFGYTHARGYLANPYKVVEVAFVDPDQTPGASGELRGETLAFLERRPNTRDQWTASLRYVLHVDPLDAALHLNYGYFHDSWGIDAHTFQADWVQPLGSGWTVTPRVRYYSQDGADFYHPYLISRQAANKVVLDDAGNVRVIPYDPRRLPDAYSSDHRLSGYGALSGGITVSKEFARGFTLIADAEYYSHAGSLKLGGGGEGAYSDFNYYAVNATLKVNLDALSSAQPWQGGHEHHGAHHPIHHGGHAPAGVMFNHMLSEPGAMMVGYRYMYGHQAGGMLRGSGGIGDAALVALGCGGEPCYVTPTQMGMHMHMLDLMYAPTGWLNLMLMPQFVDMHMFMRPLAGAPEAADPGTAAAVIHANHEHTTGGVGDTGMYALFKLLDSGGHHLHATLGVSAPTGDVGIRLRDTHRQQLGFIHYGMQLGTGTWDFKPSLTYTGRNGDWSWGAQLSGTKRLEDRNESGFAFGDSFQSTAWGSYSVLDWLSASVRGVYTVRGSLAGAYNGPYHRIGPMDYGASYGGRYWDLGLGLTAVVPDGALQGNRFSFEWIQPLHDDVNGYQLPRDVGLAATWSYGF
jgi:hypothetical protein